MSGQMRVLLISKSTQERAWMRAAFEAEPFSASQIAECEDASAGLREMQRSVFDVILIDTKAEDIRELSTQSQGAAIFFVAKPDNPTSPDAALAAGAADYLARGSIGLDALELQQAMRQGLRFHKINRERSYFAEILRERDRQVAQLTLLVNRGQRTDSRTGWPQHQQIVERLNEEMRRAGRYNLPLSVLIIQMEGIEELHRDKGSDIAGTALIEAAERVKAVARKTDICGHYNSDSFLILLTNTERDGALIFCQRVTATVESPLESETDQATLRCWFGLAEFAPDSKLAADELLAVANERLARARQQGIHGTVLAD